MESLTFEWVSKFIFQGVGHVWTKASNLLEYLSDEEYAKMPIISMTIQEKEIIERFGIVDHLIRNGETQEPIYSMGGCPFKIKVI